MPTYSSQSKVLDLQEVDWELERRVEQFEVAIVRDSSTDVGQFFPPREHPQYAEIACELLRVDMEFQFAAGRTVSAEEYRRRFPGALAQDQWFQLLQAEQQRVCGEQTSNEPTRSLLPLTAEGEIPQTGQHVCGFDLLGELGRGAFSRVYLALEHRLSKRLVVLKISSELPGEAETLSRLQHKNIVPVYSLHRHGDCYLICMPYLGALTLADVMTATPDGRTASISGESLVNTLAAKASRTWKDPSLRMVRLSSLAQDWRTGNAADDQASDDHSSTLARSRVHASTKPEELGSFSATTGSSTTSSTSTSTGSLSNAPVGWQSVPGLSSQLVDEVAKMTTTELALWLVSQLAEGLCHAHERGVLHRDIKPANVLLSDDGMPMLLDFNLAAQTRGSQSTSSVMGGTLRYMAPEQLRAVQTRQSALNPQADVYSLGVVLYELLFQRPPFLDRTGTWSDVLAQMQQDRMQLPELAVDWRAGITPAVIQILKRALAHSVDDRYTSATAFRDDLIAQLERKPLVHAGDSSLRERVSKWNARHPRWSATTIVALVAGLVIATITTGFLLRQSRMNQIAATNWFHELEHVQTTARTLLASADVPDTALVRLLDDTQTVCDQASMKRHTQSLDAHHAATARDTLARIHFYRARGAWSMYSRQPEARDSWLSKTIAELNSSHELSPAPLTSVWLETVVPLAEAQQASDSATEPESRQQLSVQASLRLRDSSSALDHELQAAQQAVAAEAGNPWHWISIGQLQMARRQLPDARSSFSLGNQLAPTEPLPAYLLGITELRLKNFPAALRWFDVVLDRDDQFPEAIFNRALVKTELGQFDEALADLDRLRDQMQRFPRAWFVREIVLRKLGRTAEAARCRSQGLAIRPTDALGWNARGEAWLREAPPQPQRALEDFDQAISVDPQYRNAYENAAHVLSEKLSQIDQAIARLDAALVIDPGYALAWSSRAVLHARSGQPVAAKSDYERALAIERSAIICYQAASALALIVQADKKREDVSALERNQQTILALLKETLRKEPSLSRFMRADQDLVELSSNKHFQELLRAAQALQ